MEMKTILTNIAKIIAPILLGGAILYWMYRGEDFMRLRHVLLEEMDWTWMLLSFPFGILAQLFRGWRWKQTLEPIASSEGNKSRSEECGVWSENTPTADSPFQGNLTPHSTLLTPQIRSSVCVYAVFLSYATSLIIPRLGEFTRCGVLKRYDGCSFSKALGTVVTERAIDTLLMGTVAGLTLLFQLSIFGTFFTQTGTSLDTILERFSLTGYLVTAVCAIAILILLHILFQSLNIYSKVKATASGIWQGVISLKDVKNLPLLLHPWHLGQLFSALLPDLLLLRGHIPLRTGLCASHFRRWLHRRHRAYPQWRRPLALRRQDDAHPLRRRR